MPPAGGVIAYADGACSGNPGPCGLGVVLIDGPTRVELSEYLGEGTNNVAELTAVLRALAEVERERAMTIYTDSQYTIGVVQKGWKAKANQDLVGEVRAALSARPSTRLAYVPGHSGVLLNERADALAREAVNARKTRRDVFVSKPGPA
jgi:ribonuclease HI